MTYPETVQLTTGLLIWLAALIGYTAFSIYYKKISKAWLLPFLKYLMFAGFLIGSHQVFEFLSLFTGSQIIYKIGLMISITGMFFYLKSLEKFYNRNFYINYFSVFIGIIAIYLFLKPVEFTTLKFHLEHHSIFLWTFVWYVLFMYWNICILFEQKYVQKFISKSLVIMYSLFVMSITFLVAVFYAVWSYLSEGVNFCTTYPSVWCTFAVGQVLFLPFFLYFLPRKMKGLPPQTTLLKKTAWIYLMFSFLITLLTMMLISQMDCLTKSFILN